MVAAVPVREVRGYLSVILGLGSFVQLQQVLAAFLQDLIAPMLT